MGSFSAFSIAVLAVISTHNIIIPVEGQCTVQDCGTGDSTISFATEIRQMFAEFHERLQAIDRRSQEQLQGMKKLNASFQQMKNQQDTVLRSIQAVDRRSQQQNICINQVQSIRELLNVSHQEAKTQHDTVLRGLEASDRRLSEHDIAMKNETQNSWKLAIAVLLDLEGVPVLPIINNWIVIMHRFDGSLNFNRNWTEYRNGFGDIGRGEFWLGNEKILRLTNRFVYTLRIEVQLRANSVWYFADYSTFSLDSESNNYTIQLSGYNGGNVRDSLTNNSQENYNLGGMSFSTRDRDNDRDGRNCASSYEGGWWYNSCRQACFTCQYADDFIWAGLKHVASDDRGRLRAARMMIKSK